MSNTQVNKRTKSAKAIAQTVGQKAVRAEGPHARGDSLGLACIRRTSDMKRCSGQQAAVPDMGMSAMAAAPERSS